MGALVEALPTVVLGGAVLVMFGMVAAMGISILSNVDFKNSRNNLFVVAISPDFIMIPLVELDFKMWMPYDIYSLMKSGILLASDSSAGPNSPAVSRWTSFVAVVKAMPVSEAVL